MDNEINAMQDETTITVNENEGLTNSVVDEKAEKFKEIANRRVNEICKKILLVGNLANRSTYHYTDEQVETIFSAMDAAISEIREKFVVKESAGKSNFINL